MTKPKTDTNRLIIPNPERTLETEQYPTLYKKTSKNKIEMWQVYTNKNIITTKFGQVGGKIQVTNDIILEGKNLGKINETTPVQQASLEAQALWTKKKKKGYVESLDDAEAGKVDTNIIKGGVPPMLAHKFRDHSKKISHPCYGQPKLDGCLIGKTQILTDLGIMSIRDIVDNKIKCKVLSYNENTKTPEFKEVLNWFNNGNTDYKDWTVIKLSNSHTIKCTNNHKIFTSNGWKRADELNKKTDKILADRGSDRLFSLMVGTLLGDSSLQVEKRGAGEGYRLVFNHVNKELLEFKVGILNLPGSIIEYTSGYGSSGWRFISNILTRLDFPVEKMYFTGRRSNCGKRKHLTYEFLTKHLSDEALSLWIADDGSLALNNDNPNTPLLNLHTQGFSEKQIDVFIEYFKNKHNCTPNKYKDKKVINGSGIFLTFNTKDTLFILNKLKALHCKGAEYKYYFKTEGYILPVLKEFNFFSFKKCKAKNSPPLTKYDLEIADNHNYFANNVLVHNCRIVSVIKDGICTLWTRTQKPVTSLPHIVKALENMFPNARNLTFDGEAYNHNLNEDFEKLISLVRPEEAVEGHETVEYHIYDLVDDKIPFESRLEALKVWFRKLNDKSPIKLVPTFEINNEEEVYENFHTYKTLGFEGIMLRNKAGMYKFGRSYDLQKVKEKKGEKANEEQEFPIIGVKAGRGKMADKAIFICQTKFNTTFDVKLEGPLENLVKYLNDESLWKGMVLTVRFQNWTKDMKPRFPVGARIRPADLSY